jgi:hypothetical protein
MFRTAEWLQEVKQQAEIHNEKLGKCIRWDAVIQALDNALTAHTDLFVQNY